MVDEQGGGSMSGDMSGAPAAEGGDTGFTGPDDSEQIR
jgi:hypothetical protein